MLELAMCIEFGNVSCLNYCQIIMLAVTICNCKLFLSEFNKQLENLKNKWPVITVNPALYPTLQ